MLDVCADWMRLGVTFWRFGSGAGNAVAGWGSGELVSVFACKQTPEHNVPVRQRRSTYSPSKRSLSQTRTSSPLSRLLRSLCFFFFSRRSFLWLLCLCGIAFTGSATKSLATGRQRISFTSCHRRVTFESTWCCISCITISPSMARHSISVNRTDTTYALN